MLILSSITIIVFFLLSAFFSGTETGLTSIDRISLEQQAGDDKKVKGILQFLKNPDRLFGTTLFGNNISLVILSTVSMLLVEQYNKTTQHQVSEHVATITLSVLVLLFGEIIPKALFRDNPNKLVRKYLPLITFFSVSLKPLIKFVEIFNNFLAKAFKIDDSNAYHHISRDDISFLLSEKPTDMHEKQREMIEDALEFAELKAENVMVHRTEVVAVQKDAKIPEIIEIASQAGFTRFPVYDEDLDDIVGILIIYDLLKADSQDTASDYMRKPNIVPETMNVDAVLSDMQAKKNSIAVVIDSYGGTAGIISIEDILEEIVGEIEDEYDVTQTNAEIQKLDEDNFIIQGYVEIDFLNDEYEMDLPDGDYETVAGMIINKLAKIPARKTKCKIGNWQVLVIQATNKKIIKLKFTRLKQ
jgi:CBS domain containing-hemolysin-like protein